MAAVFMVLGPIVLGAVIGWVTNALAIRMLFRPYKAWYVGPFRVPMTPGIIPRQRDRLAVSLGRMVSVELFREEGIVHHLRSPALRGAMTEAVSRVSASLLGMEHKKTGSRDAVAPEVPEELGRDLESLGLRLVESFVRSPRFAGLVHSVTGGLASAVLDSVPGSERNSRAFTLFVRRELRHVDLSPETRARLGRIVDALVSNWEGRSLKVADLAGNAWVPAVIDTIDALYPSLEKLLGTVLARPEIRKELHERSFVILSRTLERLNTLQRSLLWIGGYENRLRENLPEIIDDVLSGIRDFMGQDKTRLALRETLGRAFMQIADTPVSELGPRYGVSLRRLGDDILGMLFEVLRSRDVPAVAVQGTLGPSLARMFDARGEMTWRELLEEQCGLPCSDVLAALDAWVIRRLRTDGGLKLATGLVAGLIKGLGKGRQQDGEGSALSPGQELDVQQKQELDDLASGILLKALETVLPRVLEAFNIQEFVEARVADLDIEQLEGLITGLVGREFAWINILGGILGGLVGLIQVLIQQFLAGGYGG